MVGIWCGRVNGCCCAITRIWCRLAPQYITRASITQPLHGLCIENFIEPSPATHPGNPNPHNHLSTNPQTNQPKMGRELQKKKNRSSNPRVTRRKNTRVFKIKSFGNDIIRENWYTSSFSFSASHR